MSSRFLVGLGAWLLGAGIATTGSMIAVHELAHGLLVSQAQQLGAGTAGVGLTAGAASPSPSPGTPSATASSSRPPARRQTMRASASSDAPTLAGTLLESGEGSAMADCVASGAYLLYWSPDQGFWAEDVVRGPAGTASVTFRGPGAGVIMRVSCPAGVPVAHLYRLAGDDGDDGYSAGPSGSPSGGSGE
ncbi:MAG TPA: hypothetical protein VK836_08380 [Streptosporangiaceae bacterium]|nr:hypothetical protein [Streptosporangiaceae bacterium]